MSKAARLTRKVVIGTFLSTIACIMIYCLFLPLSLDFDSAERAAFLVRMLTVGVLADGICTFVVYRMYKPIGEAVRASEAGGTPADAVYARALASLEHIPNFLLWFGALAYLGASVVNLSLDLLRGGTLDLGFASARILLAIVWGFLNGIATARLLNMLLIEAKLSLKIFDLGVLTGSRGRKFQSLRSRLLVSGLALFLFLLVYAGVVAYVRLREIGELAASGAAAAAIALGVKAAISQTIGISAGLLALAVALYFIILAEMQAHFDDLLGQIARMAKGDHDLAKRVNVVSFDDIGKMTSNFNHILDTLAETFRGVRSMTKTVYDSSSAIRAASGEAKRTAASLAILAYEADEAEHQRVAELGEAVSSFKSAAEGVDGQAVRSAEEARGIEAATEGIRSMVESFAASGKEAAKAESAFGELSSAARAGAEGVARSIAAAREIDAAGERVGVIAKIIADVADRSNLLAMNASIEAAHGGAAGKGFGVVAREMKTLAMSVAKSASEINAEVKAVVDTNKRTVAAIEGLGAVFTGLSAGIESTGAALNAISGAARRNADEAERNLALLERMRTFVEDVLESSRAARGSVTAMESAADRLSSSQARSGEVNAGLTSGVRSIASAFDELESSLANALVGVSALEARVASYKLD